MVLTAIAIVCCVLSLANGVDMAAAAASAHAHLQLCHVGACGWCRVCNATCHFCHSCHAAAVDVANTRNGGEGFGVVLLL